MSANPDAALIRLCDQHLANCRAYELQSDGRDCCADPLWHVVEGTQEALRDARPVTMAGVLALARLARATAGNEPGFSPTAALHEIAGALPGYVVELAWQALDALLLLHEEAPPAAS